MLEAEPDDDECTMLGLPGLAYPTLSSPSLRVPPLAWANVEKDLYRSSYPIACNFPFVESKRLKTIICLCPELVVRESKEWASSQGINLHALSALDNKEPFLCMDVEVVKKALRLMLDMEQRPLLIHCSTGRNRTGCVVACYRILKGWSISAAIEEYLRFAGESSSLIDMQFIELFSGT